MAKSDLIPGDSTAPDWDSPEILDLIHRALDEDIGTGDSASAAIVAGDARAAGEILAKQDLVLAGLPMAERIWRSLDPSLRFEGRHADGDRVSSGSVVARLRGQARALLAGERVALNFLQHLSGIATFTRQLVLAIAAIPQSRTRVRDTRKTIPGLRQLEKYAVRLGGGESHRFGLFDAILIKENHIALAGSLRRAIKLAREKSPHLPLEVEVRSEAELDEAIAAGAPLVLLDNMAPEQVHACVLRARGRVKIEVSGGIREENIRAYAEAGADYVAVGALTHSAPAADLSFQIIPVG